MKVLIFVLFPCRDVLDSFISLLKDYTKEVSIRPSSQTGKMQVFFLKWSRTENDRVETKPSFSSLPFFPLNLGVVRPPLLTMIWRGFLTM